MEEFNHMVFATLTEEEEKEEEEDGWTPSTGIFGSAPMKREGSSVNYHTKWKAKK